MKNNQKYRQRNDVPLFDMGTVLRYLILWFVFGLIAFGVKSVVLRAFEVSPTNEVGNGFLKLYEVHNSGAAFNLFSEHPEMIITASVIALIIIASFAVFRSGRFSQSSISAMALLSAGISMNLFERINLGYVIDYIHCEFAPSIPVFNVPDVMILIGAICLVFSVFSKR